MWDVRFGVWRFEFRDSGIGIRVSGFRFRVSGFGFRLVQEDVQEDVRDYRCVRCGVFKAHILWYHSTLGSSVMKRKEKHWAWGLEIRVWGFGFRVSG